MSEIKSLADMKRALTPGRTFRVTNYLRPEAEGVRTVEKRQTRALKYRLADGRVGWLDWPARDAVRFEGTDVHFLYEPGGERVAFTFHLGE